jgi:aryl-phospho-beta-D-glucosidase BglC (GH1 family)
MKNKASFLWIVTFLFLLVIVSTELAAAQSTAGNNRATEVFPIARRANSRTPVDCSTIRGANYCYAEYGGHSGMWNNYSPAITERDLNYAQKIGINQIRCFITYDAYQRDPNQYKQNLLHLVRAADKRGIGVMPVVGYGRQMQNEGYPGAEEWAKFLVDTLGKEPGLAFWDVLNEPDYPPTPAMVERRVAFARHMAGVFRKLDGQTPVTIGFAFASTMAKYVDDVDVLVFHNYLETTEAIRADIEIAKKAAAAARKQVIDDEMGCIARANPYDITVEEHMKANIGFYVWELMIVHDPASERGWGNVHGIFYPDGTIRDPSIPLAVMGIFRNRSDNVLLENVNREGWVNTDVAAAQAWLDNPSGDWKEGLNAAEKLVNLLEGAQLIAMRELPSSALALLRQGEPNPAALREQISKYIDLLKPYERPGASATTGVRSGNMPDAPAKLEVYPMPRREGSRTPADTSTIRGANYCYAEYGGHPGMWNNYSPAITERDLNYAQKLGINQIRCFITYEAYQSDPNQYRQNLLHLVRAADQRGIGVMPVVGYGRQMQNEGYPGAEEWAKFLVDTLGREPGLAFWDVYNEPDYPPNQPQRTAPRLAFAKHIASVFRKLDGQTPITIGFAYEYTMEQCANDVDVLVYHGYQQTREAVRLDIAKAKLFASSVRKQVINDEMGCVARANPYDMAIQEYMDAHIGYYMWELMIVWNGRGWGDVHGIFYPDGTVRDPSIPIAVMGIFRNRGQNVVLEQPDREGKVTRVIGDAQKWLADPNSQWKPGLDIAEVAANLLESAQIVPLRELPTRQVEILRRGQEDRQTLKAIMEKDILMLQPYILPQRSNTTPF